MFLDLCGRIVGNTESGESAKKYFSPPWKVSGPAQTPHAQGRLHSHGDGLLAGIMTVVFLAVAIAFGFYIHIGSRGFFLSLFEGSHPLDPQSAWRPLSNRSWSCFDSCAPGLPRTRLELLNQGTRSCYVAQADLELLASSNPNSSVSQIAEIVGTSHCTWTSSDIIKQRVFSKADATCAYSIFAERLLCPH
ncbi:uncharacterized protein LOC112439800 isoform X3 [Pan paniscus]|uniref:uncharacterized protein LOC112439800 isoform X3 n=1 Tax=Pan paniscus TaxID=9597 RepID=UPI0023F1E2A5|nr:uncharacterized protein LOC745304 isoform X3 [Pan troglodytes]